MDRDIEQLFRALSAVEPSPRLAERIFVRIEQAKRRRRYAGVLFAACSILGSVAALLPVARYTAEELTRTGFFEYLSLLISDRGLIAAEWSSFAFSLLESVPFLGVTLVLASVLALLASLRLIITLTYGPQRTLSVS